MALRDPELLFDQIESRHHFRDRVLDLNPRVHFKKIELSVRCEHELDGARAGVSNLARE